MTQPMPVAEFLNSAIDDASSDLHDGLDGYVSHDFDAVSGVLSFTFETANADASDDEVPNATYRFQYLPPNVHAVIPVSDVRTAVEYEREYGGGDDFIQVMRDFLALDPAARAAKVAEWDARFERDDNA